jgi:hypothetical protein
MAEMNYILQSQEDVGKASAGKGDMDFGEVMGDWTFDGVVNNKKANNDKYGKWNFTGDDAHVTVDQYNLSYMVNYWGRDAIPGVRLFLIYKRVDRRSLPVKPNRFVLGVKRGFQDSATPAITKGEDDIPGADELGLVERPFQIIPWARRGYAQPPMSELEYIDNNGIRRFASYHCVGTVRSGSSKSTRMEYYERARYDDVAAMKLPRIWVFLGVK